MAKPSKRQQLMATRYADFVILEPSTRRDRYEFEVDALVRNRRWKSGRRFSSDDEDDYFHPPSGVIELVTEGNSRDVYPELTSHPIPLMTKRLVAALQAAGVTALQCFDTRLVAPRGVAADLYRRRERHPGRSR